MGLLAALLAGLAAALVLPVPAAARLAVLRRGRPVVGAVPLGPGRRGPGRRGPSGDAARDGPARRQAALAALLGGGATALLLGGWPGLGAGALVAVGTSRWLGRLEPAALRERRERLVAMLPVFADLLATCVEAGAPPGPAARAVAEALGDPLEAELAPVLSAVALGGDPGAAWSALAGSPLDPVGRALERSARTGSAPLLALRQLADDARAAAAAAATARARSTGARAAAPLGLCFLPAFVLSGVVPLVAGLVGEVLR